jgi:hypothetical protein
MLKRIGLAASAVTLCALLHWWLALVAVAALAVGVWLLRLWRLPFGRCWGCRGRAGRNAGSDDEQFGLCSRCLDGPAPRGARVRAGARMFHPELRK